LKNENLKNRSVEKKKNENEKKKKNPFHALPPRSENLISVYADYKHFNELFIDINKNAPSYGKFKDLFINKTDKIEDLDALFAPELQTLWLRFVCTRIMSDTGVCEFCMSFHYLLQSLSFVDLLVTISSKLT
jgi:hypothetical protein